MNSYIIYFLINKWKQYKIESLNKEIPILTTEFNTLKTIENLINELILDLNKEVNNFAYDVQLTVSKNVFLPKILEYFINLKMKEDNFYSILNRKHVKDLKTLRTYINNKIEKNNFTKKHLEKILKKVLTFKTIFTNKLLIVENNLLIVNSKIKLLTKEIFDRQLKFLTNHQKQLEQKNIIIEQQKTKIQNNIKNIKIKLAKQLKMDYKNSEFTSFKVILEIPKKANLKIASLEKTIAKLELTQYKLRQKIYILQQKNNEVWKKFQSLQRKNNELNFNQKNIRDQQIKLGNRHESVNRTLENKTLINNLTMSLLFSEPPRNCN